MLSNFKYLYFLLLILVVACAKETSFKPDILPTSLFINARIDPTIGIDVSVSKAISTGDTITIQSLLIKDAKVILLDEQQNKRLIPHFSNGRYTLDANTLEIIAGKKYQLQVNAPTIGTAISEWIEVPDAIQLDTLILDFDGGTNIGNTVSGYFEFKDKNNKNDYYICKAYGKVENRPLIVPNYTLKINDLCDVTGYSFNENCFENSTNFKGYLSSDSVSFFEDIGESKDISTFIFQIGKITKSYYDYIRSINQPEEWENAFIEPRQTFTNFQNGFGVFYASNTVSKEVNF